MGRAARRAQQKAERRQQTQRRQAPPRAARPTLSPSPTEDGRRSGRGSLLKPRWAMDVISELRKVTWPSRQETAHLTVVVLVVSALLGVVLGGADLGFSWLVEQTILR